MPRIQKRPEARADLRAIFRYVARDDVDAATKLIRRIDEVFHKLAEHPGIGRSRNELAPHVRSFRATRNYVVFYQPTDEGIEVIRVLHSSRDVRRLFNR